jgi:TRAP transporter 4TM/12TM fusion protein
MSRESIDVPAYVWHTKTTLQKITSVAGVMMCVYAILFVLDVFPKLGIYIMVPQHLAMFLGLLLLYTFLSAPAKKGMKRNTLPWYDILFILASLAACGYIVLFQNEVNDTRAIGLAEPHQIVLAALLIAAILEGARRVVGLSMTIIAACFLVYSFFSNYFPGILFARQLSIPRAANAYYLTGNGIFGIPMSVASTIMIMFIIFAAVLFYSGAAKYFISLAMSLFGHVRGGPAKVAIVGSAGMGTISGSTVGNIAAVGSVTIPLMKSIGYDKDFAGAVECVASKGGTITPPVMGAVAFLMSEWIGVGYDQICIAAALPAFLYYLGLFVQVDLEAAKTGLKGLPRASLPSFLKVFREGWIYAVALIGLIVMLIVFRYRPEASALYAAGVMWLIGLTSKKSRLGLRGIIGSLDYAAKTFTSAGMACAAAGIILGSLLATGMGTRFSIELVALSGGSLEILLILSAIAAFVLGMGVGTMTIYVVLATLVAPALQQMGVSPMASHLYVIYWADVSFITPPVALAAFIAISISGGNLWKTGWLACRLAIATFIVPFMFVYQPALLLQGQPLDIIIAVTRSIIGIVLLAIGAEGYLLLKINWVQRVLLMAAGILLMLPWLNTTLIAVVLAVPLLCWHIYKKYRISKTNHIPNI